MKTFLCFVLYVALLASATKAANDSSAGKSIQERIMESRGLLNKKDVPSPESLRYEDIHEHELHHRTQLVNHLEKHRRVLHEQRHLLSQDHVEQLHNQIHLYERKLAQMDAETPEQKLNKYRDMMETMNDEMLRVDELDFEATGI